MDKPEIIKINNNHYMISQLDSSIDEPKEQIVDNITPESQSQPITTKSFIRPTIPVKQKNNDYTKKGYYFLSEANYWYLKDISQFNTMTAQDYLNALLEFDRKANADVLSRLYHNEYYTEKND